MYYIPYERVSHLLAIAKQYQIFQIDIDCSEPMCLRFSDYVKSQIHLNFVSDFFDRSIIPYKKVFDSLSGGLCGEQDYLKVLQFFYTDLSLFFLNCDYEIPLTFEVDVAMNIPEHVVDFGNTRMQLAGILSVRPNSFESALTTVTRYDEFMTLFDKIQNFGNLQTRLNNYTMSAILLNKKHRNTVIKVDRRF